MNFSKTDFFCRALLIFWACFLFVNCKEIVEPSKGELLARNLCASCHVFPEPSLLSKDVWMSETLPEMGLRLGMSNHGPEYYDKGLGDNIYPEKPMLTQADWESLVMYYNINAPKKIPLYKQKPLKTSTVFNSKTFASTDTLSAIITLIKYNKNDHSVYLGDGGNSSLVNVNDDGKILSNKKLISPPVKIHFKDSCNQILTIGSLYPSNDKKGILDLCEVTIDSLRRPVDFLMKDVNEDGLEDVLVAEFGNTIGSLVWYEKMNNNAYNRQVIHPFSGSIKIKYADIDHDGQDELMALFAQESESLYVFTFENDAFSIKEVLKFNPAFGVNDFHTVDMNNDGLLDVIISNGDNADYSTVLKNYHGIRIYLNEGNYKFTEAYFYPYHGVSKIEVADFNLDGRQDVLAISNFGDLTDDKFESVILLKGTGPFQFEPTRIADIPRYGWQTIDVSDYDGDGDKDVFIGAFNIRLGPKESLPESKEKASWIRLENLTNN